MEVILFIGGLLLLDLLAMHFGVDSRALNLRQEHGWWPNALTGDALRDYAASHQIQLHYEAEVERVAGLATVAQVDSHSRPLPGLRAGEHTRLDVGWRRGPRVKRQVSPAD